MDAPLYPPSSAYVAPERVAEPLTTANASFADFIANPPALAILLEEVPELKMMMNTSMLKPHLGNMGPRTLIAFGGGHPERLDKVDVRLKALGLMMGGKP